MSSVVNTKGDINDGTSSSGALAVEDKAFHGGQDWMTTENLIADFSVTTGIMGPCKEALSFLDGNLHKIRHYPALDQEPYRSELKVGSVCRSGALAVEDKAFHGGQDWMTTENLIADFSVTTGIMGPCEEALSFLDGNLHKIHHYPALDQEPYRSELKSWLGLPHEYVLMGNGSSELIDLIIRLAPRGNYAVGPNEVQYKEYENSCHRYDRVLAENPKEASLHVFVNPTNPTGEYLSVEKTKSYIEETCRNGSYVVIDESMLPWFGPRWREASVYYQFEWVNWMLTKRDIHIVVIHSWTKIFCCTGLRIGSIILPCKDDFDLMKKYMIPWNVNVLAGDYLSVCMRNKEYLQQTWETTSNLRKIQKEQLEKEFPDWDIKGEAFLSWMWIDTKSEQVAEKAVTVAKAWGCPIRWGKKGYNRPTHIRLAVRKPELFQVLFSAFKQELKSQ